MKCESCKKREPSYEVTADGKKLTLCDYCYHIMKWKSPEKELVVESHISTKASIEAFQEAIRDCLFPQMRKLMTKELAKRLFEIDINEGMDSFIRFVRNNHKKIKEFSIKNNLNYPDLTLSIRLFSGE